ncbi:MAG TPA: hypothetical protein VGW37_18850 [Terriglobia bacterium]|nr:hypothetical protein [Terriglobia bacterium]
MSTFSAVGGLRNHASQFEFIPAADVLPRPAIISPVDCNPVSVSDPRWTFGFDEIVARLSEHSQPRGLGLWHGCQFHRPAVDFLPLLFFESQKRAMTRTVPGSQSFLQSRVVFDSSS